jgi:hypothetical protein
MERPSKEHRPHSARPNAGSLPRRMQYAREAGRVSPVARKVHRPRRMKTAHIIGSILLFLAAGVAVAYGADRARFVAERQQHAEASLAKIRNTQDMAEARAEMTWIEVEAPHVAKATDEAKLAFGGAAVLLLGSVVLFVRGRRRRLGPGSSHAAPA